MRITLLATNLMTLDSFIAHDEDSCEDAVTRRIVRRGQGEYFSFLSHADGKHSAEVFYAVSTKAEALRNMRSQSLDFFEALADANADARAYAARDRRTEYRWVEVDRRKAEEDRREMGHIPMELTQEDRDEIMRARDDRNGDGQRNVIGRP